MKIKEFLEQWSGDICIIDSSGNVYCSFRENVTPYLMNQEIKKIDLVKEDIVIIF